MIGIIGASGAVGTAAIHQLQAWNLAPLRRGSRSGGIDRVRVDAQVDAMDEASLRTFCEGCSVIVDCSGPSSPELVQRVARAAFDAGADYATPAGGDFVFDVVGLVQRPYPRRTALIAAGMMPGLTALLPRALAPASRLTAYIGGRGAFTRSAAIDFLGAHGDGRALAAWRDGARVAAALTPLRDVELPFFPGTVSAYPYLSGEAERVARAIGLADASWYTVFDGSRTIAALTDAERLVRASALDLFGRTPYQRMVFMADERTIVLHGRDASELTGAVAALAASALLDGTIPSGVYYAGEVLDPDTALASLRTSIAVTAIDTPQLQSQSLFEEGVL